LFRRGWSLIAQYNLTFAEHTREENFKIPPVARTRVFGVCGGKPKICLTAAHTAASAFTSSVCSSRKGRRPFAHPRAIVFKSCICSVVVIIATARSCGKRLLTADEILVLAVPKASTQLRSFVSGYPR